MVSDPFGIRRGIAGVRGWLDAWWAEVVALVPRRLRHLLWFGKYNLVLESDGRALDVRRVTPQHTEPLGRYLLDHSAGEEGPSALEADSASAEQVMLCLPPASVLRRRVVLPRAAEENLREVLAFEMDRQTPFAAEQVYYDYHPLPHAGASGTLEVDLFVARRAEVDGLLERLAAERVVPDVVAVCAAGAAWDAAEVRLNLLPPERRRHRSSLTRRLNLALAALLVLLLAAALLQPVVDKAGRVEALEREVAAAQTAALEVGKLQERLTKLTTQSEFLVRKKRDTVPALELLREVTGVLPDHTWISGFELKAGEVRLQGESREAAALVALVESSPLLRKARFQAALTQNPQAGTERFQLSAEVAREGAP
jgi:general secretion pathway protein L